MLIRKFTHACLHIVDGDANILIDPGSYSTGAEQLAGVTTTLLPHAHLDHLDPTRLARVAERNPDAAIYADSGSATAIAVEERTADLAVTVVAPGDRWHAGTTMEAFGGEHAVIHQDIPRISNVGYIVGGRLCHPGDSLVLPAEVPEILALPIAAPWMAFKEAVDYVRAVAPRVVVPIHEGVLAAPPSAYARLKALLPAATELVVIDDGAPVEL